MQIKHQHRITMLHCCFIQEHIDQFSWLQILYHMYFYECYSCNYVSMKYDIRLWMHTRRLNIFWIKFKIRKFFIITFSPSPQYCILLSRRRSGPMTCCCDLSFRSYSFRSFGRWSASCWFRLSRFIYITNYTNFKNLFDICIKMKTIKYHTVEIIVETG
jgi:hypothetical protein